MKACEKSRYPGSVVLQLSPVSHASGEKRVHDVPTCFDGGNFIRTVHSMREVEGDGRHRAHVLTD